MARKRVSPATVIALAVLLLAVERRTAEAQVGQWTTGSLEGWFGSLAVDPSDPWRLYSVAQSDAIFTSDNAGVSWGRMDLPFPRSYALAISPSRLSALYAFDRDNATGNARVFRSRDRGLHWNLTSFQSEDFPNSVAVDPTNVSTVYALTERGLYKSTDSGASWENLKLRENATRRVFQILFPPRETSTAYVVDADYSYYPEYTVDKSTDGGRTWRTIVTGPTQLAIDPFNPSHLYGIGCPGSYRSTDAGATWTQAAPIASTACASSLVPDPVRRGYLYAGLYVGGVKRSRDAGNTWEQLGVGIHGNVFSLAIDPVGLFLHASTSAGVFDLQLGELPVSPCSPDAERLCLLGGRFEVSAKYGDVAALAVPQGDRFGSFRRSGTAAEEPEIFVKMADHRAVSNPAFWFFHTSVTDLGYTITVRDAATGRVRFYRNEPANPGCGAADTGAFFEGSFSSSSDELGAASNLASGDGEMLSLVGGRFQATISIVNPFTGASDAGLAMAQTDRLGYFSFSSVTGDTTFPEVFVAISDSFSNWAVSHTGLTNLPYTLKVTDRQTGVQKLYQNGRDDVFNLCGGYDPRAFE